MTEQEPVFMTTVSMSLSNREQIDVIRAHLAHTTGKRPTVGKILREAVEFYLQHSLATTAIKSPK